MWDGMVDPYDNRKLILKLQKEIKELKKEVKQAKKNIIKIVQGQRVNNYV